MYYHSAGHGGVPPTGGRELASQLRHTAPPGRVLHCDHGGDLRLADPHLLGAKHSLQGYWREYHRGPPVGQVHCHAVAGISSLCGKAQRKCFGEQEFCSKEQEKGYSDKDGKNKNKNKNINNNNRKTNNENDKNSDNDNEHHNYTRMQR